MLPWLPMLAKGGNPAWVFLFLLFWVVLGVSQILKGSKTREQRTALALRLGGRYERGSLFSNETLHFKVADRSSMLEFRGGRGAFTSLSVPLPASAAGTLKVTTVQLGWEMLRLVGYDSIRIGDPSFDASFAVTGDRDLIRRVFDPERRARAMEAVRRLAEYPGLTIELGSRSLQLRFRGTLDDEDFVLKTKRSAEDFVALVFGPPPATGIEWGESAEQPAGLCPICTTVLKEPLIRCPRCSAPHHRECWEYLGRCAVYGCEPKPGQRAA